MSAPYSKPQFDAAMAALKIVGYTPFELYAYAVALDIKQFADETNDDEFPQSFEAMTEMWRANDKEEGTDVDDLYDLVMKVGKEVGFVVETINEEK